MLNFRRATIEDVDLYFDWAQESGTRDFALNRDPIRYADHVKWFRQKIASERCLLLVAFEAGGACGQIRFDVEGVWATISFSIAQAFRGRGYSTVLLVQGARLCREHFGDKTEIYGVVVQENKASVRAFVRAGFQVADSFQREGFACLRFEAPKVIAK